MRKKRFSLRIPPLLLVFLLLFPSVFAESYVSVDELRKQASERWRQSYETKWRTVEIDVQPQVPDVEAVPILMVAPDWSFPEALTQNAEWESHYRDDGIAEIYLKAWGETSPEEYRRVRQIKNKAISEIWHYPPYDMERVYAEGSEVSFGSVMNEIEDMLLRVGIGTEDWYTERPIDLCAISKHTKQGEYLASRYIVDIVQKLRGIPLYNRSCSRESEKPLNFDMMVNRYGSDSISFLWRKLKILEVITEDIPLCDFSTIRSAIEEKIYSGNIRKIFDVDFGYALFNPPGVTYRNDTIRNESSFTYAVPMWRVSCHYASSGGKKLRDYTGLDVPERGVMEYEELMFYAQTGEMFNSMNTRRGDGEYRGFISWEDVGGKR